MPYTETVKLSINVPEYDDIIICRQLVIQRLFGMYHNGVKFPEEYDTLLCNLTADSWIKIYRPSSPMHGVVGRLTHNYTGQFGRGFVKYIRPRGDKEYFIERFYVLPHEPTEKELCAYLAKRLSE